MKTTHWRAIRAVGVLALLVLTDRGLRADDAEDKVAQAIKNLGGVVKRDEMAVGKPVIEVSFYNTKATDADLKQLTALKSLKGINLTGTMVTDAGLKELAAIKTLEALNVFGTKVTDAGKAQFRKALPKCKVFPG